MSLLDNASLLLTPNAYKEGKLYSVIPSNGNGDFTATRATTATRVNSAGLVDLVPYNLASWSEMFSNAAWGKSASSVSANTTTAPDGALTADTFTGDGTLNVHTLFQVFTVTNGVNYSWSFYAKKNTHNFIQLSGSAAGFGVNVWANFDINNGVVGSVGSLTTASIQSVGNGWYRCTIVGAAIASTSTNINLLLVSSATSLRGESNTLSTSVFLWGAQLVEGTSARDYLRTETRLNIPRVDYSLGGCPNILLEPQRTNLALQSSSFDNASWTKTGVSVTANNTTSPSGIVDADRITPTGTGYHSIQQTTFTTSGNTSLKVYAKYNGYNIWIQIGATSGSTAFFDLQNGTTTNTTTFPTTFGTGFTQVSKSITALGNGWYECNLVASGSSTLITYGVAVNENTATYTADGTSGIFLWGAQLEAGAYATSYIPTTTASVTRNADSITRNNIFTNGLITAAGGTWFVELRNNRAIPRDTFSEGIRIINVATGSNNGFEIRNAGTVERLYIIKRLSGVVTTLMVTTTDTVKLAIKWNGSTADVFVNGVKVVAATAFAFTALDTVSGNGTDVPKFINEMALFPTPLTDAQCLALTA